MLSDFVSSFFEHNDSVHAEITDTVVNCFQILYLRSLNTINSDDTTLETTLWIAFRFCIFVLWTQFSFARHPSFLCCELLSDFVSSFFEHNYTSTILPSFLLWIAFRFCIFVLWTQCVSMMVLPLISCELLSDFVSSFFEHNEILTSGINRIVVNCFQILYLRSLNTMISKLL